MSLPTATIHTLVPLLQLAAAPTIDRRRFATEMRRVAADLPPPAEEIDEILHKISRAAMEATRMAAKLRADATGAPEAAAPAPDDDKAESPAPSPEPPLAPRRRWTRPSSGINRKRDDEEEEEEEEDEDSEYEEERPEPTVDLDAPRQLRSARTLRTRPTASGRANSSKRKKSTPPRRRPPAKKRRRSSRLAGGRAFVDDDYEEEEESEEDDEEELQEFIDDREEESDQEMDETQQTNRSQDSDDASDASEESRPPLLNDDDFEATTRAETPERVDVEPSSQSTNNGTQYVPVGPGHYIPLHFERRLRPRRSCGDDPRASRRSSRTEAAAATRRINKSIEEEDAEVAPSSPSTASSSSEQSEEEEEEEEEKEQREELQEALDDQEQLQQTRGVKQEEPEVIVLSSDDDDRSQTDSPAPPPQRMAFVESDGDGESQDEATLDDHDRTLRIPDVLQHEAPLPVAAPAAAPSVVPATVPATVRATVRANPVVHLGVPVSVGVPPVGIAAPAAPTAAPVAPSPAPAAPSVAAPVCSTPLLAAGFAASALANVLPPLQPRDVRPRDLQRTPTNDDVKREPLAETPLAVGYRSAPAPTAAVLLTPPSDELSSPTRRLNYNPVPAHMNDANRIAMYAVFYQNGTCVGCADTRSLNAFKFCPDCHLLEYEKAQDAHQRDRSGLWWNFQKNVEKYRR
ncbi:hypothetical protein M3Y99_01828600 [Aphelenchoides fujianensis]|nr:hypothetical protein M3Y99_01828600 [Aphelenchoides fujianensis]